MATRIIRNVDPAIEPRVHAACDRRAMEAGRRAVDTETGAAEPQFEVNLAAAIRRRFAPSGGVDDREAHPPVQVGDAAFEEL